MTDLITFLWLASLVLSLFFACYYFFLRQEKAFRFNRFYLLGGLMLTVLIPAAILSGHRWLPVSSVEPVANLSSQIVALPAYTLSASEQLLPAVWPWKAMLLWVYLAGLAVAALRLFVRLFQLRHYLACLRFRPIEEGFYLAEENGNHSSFSFFHYIIINPAEAANADEYEQILRHEKAHARQKHSLDVLLVEAMLVFLWFLPTAYWLRNSLQEVHEYLADEEVMGRQQPDPTYIKLMARISLRAAGLPVTSPFNRFNTLNRIRMIQKKSKPSWLRLSAGLLLAGGMSCFIACDKEEPLQEDAFPQEITISEQEGAKEEEIFTVVDDQPEPEGGFESFHAALGKELTYPAAAKEAGIEGRVFIRFVVQADGTASNFSLILGSAKAGLSRDGVAKRLQERNEAVTEEAIDAAMKQANKYRTEDGRVLPEMIPVYEALDQEALRACQALDLQWVPGRKNGAAVPVEMVIPISFKL